jgi:hypothetical protein
MKISGVIANVDTVFTMKYISFYRINLKLSIYKIKVDNRVTFIIALE